MTCFWTSSSRVGNCSPRPSARRSRSGSAIRGTNLRNWAERMVSITSLAVSRACVPPPRRRHKRKSTQAPTFSCVCGASLPCWSSAHRHPSGNCWDWASNLYKFLSMLLRNSVFFFSSTSARVFWNGAEKNSRKRLRCVVPASFLPAAKVHSTRESNFVESDFNHDEAKWWSMLTAAGSLRHGAKQRRSRRQGRDGPQGAARAPKPPNSVDAPPRFRCGDGCGRRQVPPCGAGWP
mmetsp:Transcript_9917/g.26197  ORF Transcript_9917/g.26197 Transcript_9917/m.26197 type:complete len:235 (+) Transcript_9917:2614-3318(+)